MVVRFIGHCHPNILSCYLDYPYRLSLFCAHLRCQIDVADFYCHDTKKCIYAKYSDLMKHCILLKHAQNVQDRYSPTILENCLSLVLQIFLYLEVFECNTTSDWLNRTV